MLEQIVIVGGGHGGFQTVLALHQSGYTGKIVLIDNETNLPYQRPPLSKAFMKGDISQAALVFKPEKFYADNNIERVVGQVASIDRVWRRVQLDDGSAHSYDHLILATGARNRLLDVPGGDLDGVHGLRTLADATALSQRLATISSVVVIGAGFIGLEFAAVARAAGATVHVVEMASRVMARAVSEPVSGFFLSALAADGIQFHFGQQVSRVLGADGKATAIETTTGRKIVADLIVYGIGVLPNVELATAAGIDCANGISVDRLLSTSDPFISAIGDCASFPHPETGLPIRLESVQNAADQARCVVRRLMGDATSFAAIPWFWSEQGNLRLQIAGIASGYDQTLVVGDPVAHKYSVLCYKGGTLIAVESTNSPVDHIVARRILSSNIRPSFEDASRADFSLKDWEIASKAA